MFPNGPPAGTVSAVSAQPTVGRIVHYTSLGDRDGKYPSELHAALITKVINPALGIVALHVFYATGQFDMPKVDYTFEPAGSDSARGCWSWPTIVHGREISGSTGAGLGDDGHVNDTGSVAAALRKEADRHDIRRAITVLFENRHGRPKSKTVEDLKDILRLVEDKLEALGRNPDA